MSQPPLEFACAAAQRARSAHEAYEDESARRVRSAAEKARKHVRAHTDAVRRRADSCLRLGQPPSLRQLCGTSHLEVPMNAVLGWLFDPDGSHGLGRCALDVLLQVTGSTSLWQDVHSGGALERYVEVSPPDGFEGRAPDLLFRSDRGALLVENKVESGWSDANQPSDYLDGLRDWAGPRSFRAVLLAPHQHIHQDKWQPDGWSPPVSHQSLADALRPLIRAPDLSIWSRVVVALVVSDLRGTDPHQSIRRIRATLQRARGRPLRIDEARRLETWMDAIDLPAPWQDL